MIPIANPALPAVDIPESVEEDDVADLFEESADPVDVRVDRVELGEEDEMALEEIDVLWTAALEVEVKYCENGLLAELAELAEALATVASVLGEEAAAVGLALELATVGAAMGSVTWLVLESRSTEV